MAKLTQTEMPGTSTTLSDAADDLISARLMLEAQKEALEDATLRFVNEMDKANKQIVTHKGRKLSVVERPGKIVVRIK